MLPNSKLFREGSIYPRRYFDDLVDEYSKSEAKVRLDFNNTERGIGTEQKLKDILSNKLPFGVVSAKNARSPDLIRKKNSIFDSTQKTSNRRFSETGCSTKEESAKFMRGT
jgi:hypothetical protein